jgi:hypothetical protein
MSTLCNKLRAKRSFVLSTSTELSLLLLPPLPHFLHLLLLLRVCLPPAAAAGTGVGEDSMSAALHKVVHEVLGDELTLGEAQSMLAEVDQRNTGKISLNEVSV